MNYYVFKSVKVFKRVSVLSVLSVSHSLPSSLHNCRLCGSAGLAADVSTVMGNGGAIMANGGDLVTTELWQICGEWRQVQNYRGSDISVTKSAVTRQCVTVSDFVMHHHYGSGKCLCLAGTCILGLVSL